MIMDSVLRMRNANSCLLLKSMVLFYNDLIQYIYENHFEESDEWKIISRNLVYTSTQRMATGEGNTILIQLDALKRRELELRFAIDWKLVHPDIIRVARSLYQKVQLVADTDFASNGHRGG